MRVLFLLVIFGLANSSIANAQAINFSSTAGMLSTCNDARQKKSAELHRDDEKVATVICSGIDLLTDTMRWGTRQMSITRVDQPLSRASIRAKAEEILGKLA